jgi:hypothetical protein
MTQFLDVRLSPVGGELSTCVAIHQGTTIHDYAGLDRSQLLNDIQGRHVLLGTHGFNVNRADGIAGLSRWESLLRLSASSPVNSLATGTVFVGILWPGDSVYAHGLDYPEEPRVANDAGERLIAPFLDANFTGAASLSFVSHSLGARLVLKTVAHMELPVRRVILMAGAVGDNCLNTEFRAAAAKIDQISVLASRKDEALSLAYPLGNLAAGIIAEGHPWWRSALGHSGPSKPRPRNFLPPFAIPDNWEFRHGSYLQQEPPPVPVLPLPVDVPPNHTPEPANGVPGWHEAFSSAFCSTRFQ